MMSNVGIIDFPVLPDCVLLKLLVLTYESDEDFISSLVSTAVNKIKSVCRLWLRGSDIHLQ
jgi:hypothetical protein